VSYKPKEKFMQYSKKMASRVTVFWMLYRIVNFIVVLIRPDVSKYLVDLSTGVDTVMIINVGFYTGNSISEKAVLGFGKRKSLYSSDDEDKSEDKSEDEDEDESEESCEDNG